MLRNVFVFGKCSERRHTSAFALLNRGLEMMFVRYLESAPTLGEIDILLSFRITTSLRPEAPALFNPS